MLRDVNVNVDFNRSPNRNGYTDSYALNCIPNFYPNSRQPSPLRQRNSNPNPNSRNTTPLRQRNTYNKENRSPTRNHVTNLNSYTYHSRNASPCLRNAAIVEHRSWNVTPTRNPNTNHNLSWNLGSRTNTSPKVKLTEEEEYDDRLEFNESRSSEEEESTTTISTVVLETMIETPPPAATDAERLTATANSGQLLELVSDVLECLIDGSSTAAVAAAQSGNKQLYSALQSCSLMAKAVFDIMSVVSDLQKHLRKLTDAKLKLKMKNIEGKMMNSLLERQKDVDTDGTTAMQRQRIEMINQALVAIKKSSGLNNQSPIVITPSVTLSESESAASPTESMSPPRSSSPQPPPPEPQQEPEAKISIGTVVIKDCMTAVRKAQIASMSMSPAPGPARRPANQVGYSNIVNNNSSSNSRNVTPVRRRPAPVNRGNPPQANRGTPTAGLRKRKNMSAGRIADINPLPAPGPTATAAAEFQRITEVETCVSRRVDIDSARRASPERKPAPDQACSVSTAIATSTANFSSITARSSGETSASTARSGGGGSTSRSFTAVVTHLETIEPVKPAAAELILNSGRSSAATTVSKVVSCRSSADQTDPWTEGDDEEHVDGGAALLMITAACCAEYVHGKLVSCRSFWRQQPPRKLGFILVILCLFLLLLLSTLSEIMNGHLSFMITSVASLLLP